MQVNSLNNTYFTGKKERQYSRKTGLAGSVLGTTAGVAAVTLPLATADVFQIRDFIRTNKDISEASVSDLKKVFEQSGLSSKGVELVDIKKGMTEECERVYMEAYTSVPKVKKIIKRCPAYKKFLAGVVKENSKGVVDGYNAFALFPNKKILINMDKFGFSLPHEIGHQINCNLSKFGKALQKSRALGVYTPLAILPVALFSKKRDKNDKQQNIFQKTIGFIRNNAGKLMTLGFVPIVAEETLASVKGLKLAKTILNKNDYKKALRVSIVGGSSYYMLALLAGVGTWLGIKVKDNYIEKHKQEK